MTVRELIKSDFKRCGVDKVTFSEIAKVILFAPNQGLKFLVIFRLTQHYRRRNRLFFYFFYLWWRRLTVKFGINISYRTTIGKGLYIGHFGGITIHGDVVIGDNCNLSHNISIGVSLGRNSGVPKIGSRVLISPGAIILGSVEIGNDVLVGTNTVVTFNVPDNSVVAAPLGTIISEKGSGKYIYNTA